MINYIIHNGELYHHGVKGMKWGVRRYQNADGSLTAAGKRRKQESENQLDKISEVVLTRRLHTREVSDDDPTRVMQLRSLSDEVQRNVEKGKRVVDRMKQEGLISNKTSFDDYAAKYEQKMRDNCRKYVSQKYGVKDLSDDEFDDYMLAYIYGAI